METVSNKPDLQKKRKAYIEFLKNDMEIIDADSMQKFGILF
jgi:hypothetical protein